MKRGIVLGAFGIVGVFIACSGGDGPSTFPSGIGEDAGIDANDPRYSFSALNAARSCAEDSDCVLTDAVSNCSTCCSQGAVSRGEGERQHEAVLAACREPGAPRGVGCLMACAEQHAGCFEGTCVAFLDFDAGSPVACTPGKDASDGGTPALGAGPACGAAPVHTDFDDAPDPAWAASDATAFRIDHDDPIAGAGSLRIAYQQKTATLAFPQPNACAVRLAFTVRTHLVQSSISLARITVGDGAWLHLRLDGCALSVAQELRTSEAASLAQGNPIASIPNDIPVRVVLTLDLRAKTLATAVAKIGDALPSPTTTPLAVNPPDANAIRTVELGSTPGIQSVGIGIVWIDDLSID